MVRFELPGNEDPEFYDIEDIIAQNGGQSSAVKD